MKSQLKAFVAILFISSIFAGNLSANDAINSAFNNFISANNLAFGNTNDQAAALSNFQTNFHLANSFAGTFSLTTEGKFSLMSPSDFKKTYLTLGNTQVTVSGSNGFATNWMPSTTDFSSFFNDFPSTSTNTNTNTTPSSSTNTATKTTPSSSTNTTPSTSTAAPASLDLRNSGLVTAVKDQGTCGCCWAFSAIASLEGAYAKKHGSLVSFSEQNLLSCTGSNDSCNGGIMNDAYKFVATNGGIATESSYGYKGAKATCSSGSKTAIAMSTSNYYTNISSYTVAQMKAALYSNGPISIGINADNLQLYKTGIYSCSSGVAINHGVTIVGYGSGSSGDYWIVKNSWGSSWGQSGYFFLSQSSTSNCGMNTYAVQPLLS